MKIRKKLTILLAMLLVLCSFSNRFVDAKTKVVKVSVKKLIDGKQVLLKNCPGTMQNFAYSPDGKYIFGSNTGTQIFLFAAPSEPGADAVSECLDSKQLKNYGHGDAIFITQPKKSKEVYHLWTAKNPGKSGYGRDIVRITVAIEDGKMVFKKRVVLNNFIKTNVINGKACNYEWNPTLERVDVSVDEKNNQIVFRVGCYTCINYVAYDFKQLSKALDKVGNNKKYNMAKAAKWQKANLRTNLVPNINFQGYQAIDNTVYVCGGHFGRGAGIYAIKYDVHENGKAVQQDKYEAKYIDKNIKLGVSDKDEIEGVKIKRNKKGGYDMFVSFCAEGDNGLKWKTIYKFDLKK